MRLRISLLAIASLLLPAAAQAAPTLGLSKSAPAQVLYGTTAPVTLTASNGGPDWAYNASFRDVLPTGISYVPASATPAPNKILVNQPAAGRTTLIWENLADISPGSTHVLTYSVSHNPATVDVPDPYTNTAGVYGNSDPRTLPKFDATTGVPTAGFDGSATASATSKLVPLTLTKTASAGEALRGVHDHPIVYTLRVDNNLIAATGSVVVDDYLPAGLELLCGSADHTTNAPTNPGSTLEYALAPALAPAACSSPSLVETLGPAYDPDGAGGLPPGTYTHARWTVGNMAAAQTTTITYKAAIPVRQNTVDWNGAATGNGTAPATNGPALAQGSNLNNNSGPETFDEQALTNYSTAGGNFRNDPAKSASTSSTATVTAEDVQQDKSVDHPSLNIGEDSQWTITTRTSEYRFVDNIRITDTVPDGLCPISTSVNYEGTAECAPAAGRNPVGPFNAATENVDGSWTVTWNSTSDARLAQMGPSQTVVTTFWTRARRYHQQNGVEQPNDPISATDPITNNVTVLGTDFAICAPGPKICTDPSKKIDHDETEGVDDLDEGSAGQSAGAVTLSKDVLKPSIAPGTGATTCPTATGSYQDADADGYGPGDIVCWRLRVAYPAQAETRNAIVRDFIPPGNTYIAGTQRPTAANTTTVASFANSDPQIEWLVGTGSPNRIIPFGGEIFEYVFATKISTASAAASFDLIANLMKTVYSNRGASTFSLRDAQNFVWNEPQLSIKKGAVQVNGSAASGSNSDPDHVQVIAGDDVTYGIDVSNSGRRAALNSEIWDRLPVEIACSDVISIQNGGACSGTKPNAIIKWTIASISGKATSGAANVTTRLTYHVRIPASISPNQQLDNLAGVRSYRGTTNDTNAPTFTYYPANNIDPSAPATVDNTTDRADDPSDVFTPDLSLVKSRTTSVNEAGNDLPSQATIGERIDYSVTLTIPAGTTIYGSQVVDQTHVGQTLLATPAPAATLNGSPLPGGFSLSTASNNVTLTLPTPYVNAEGSGDDTVVITYSVRVDELPANVRGNDVRNTAALNWRNQEGGTEVDRTAGTATRVVEPDLDVTKANDDADAVLNSGQTLGFTLTARNLAGADVSLAHDLVVVDVLPVGYSPFKDGAATILASDGDTIAPNGGIWSSAARTITWTRATTPSLVSVAPGASAGLSYKVKLTSAGLVGEAAVNNVRLTGTGLDGVVFGERTSTSGTNAGYVDTDSNTLRWGQPSLAKSVTPAVRTIGQQVTFTVDVAVPAGLRMFDATVFDALPDGLNLDAYVSVVCLTGCGSPLDSAISTFSPIANVDGSTTLGWYFGDITDYDPTANGIDDPVSRSYRLTYTAHVDDTYEGSGTPAAGQPVKDADTLTNQAVIAWNITNRQPTKPASTPTAGFDGSRAPVTADVSVVEPKLDIDKRVSCQVADTDICNVQSGDGPFTYTLVVRNQGTSPAHDVTVSDLPDAELVNVIPVTGAAFVTDGWTAADRDIVWQIPGPIPVGGSVTLTYTADLAASSTLAANDHVKNTASIGHYFGAPQATRAANPTWDFPDYPTDPNRHPANDPTLSDTVDLTLDFPHITIAKTTGAGNELDNAEIGQPFDWKITITNDGRATARNVSLHDVLPPNWDYTGPTAIAVTGPAGQLLVAANQAPTVSGTAVPGKALDWTNVANLNVGERLTFTVATTPRPDARTNSGPGAVHINTALATAQDKTGAAGNADGDYADGTDAGTAPDEDTAKGNLLTPGLTIVKKPDCGPSNPDPDCGAPVAAGQTGIPFAIEITNTGVSAARNLVVTDVLPDGLIYQGPAVAVVCDPLNAPACGPADLPFPVVAASPFVTLGAPAYTEDATQLNTPDPGQTTVVYRLDRLRPGATVRFRFAVDSVTPWPSPFTFTNTARVHSDELPDDVADIGALQITSKPFWFGVDNPSFKTSNPIWDTNRTTEDEINYTVHYANTGNAIAHQTVLTDAVPTNTVYVAGSAGATPTDPVEFKVGGIWQSSEPANAASVEAVRWQLGTVATTAPDNAGDVHFKVKTKKPLVNGTIVSNIAEITSREERDYIDPVSGNAAPIAPSPIGKSGTGAPLTHPVVTAPVLALAKEVSASQLDVNTQGRRLDYTLRLTNTGNEDALGAVIEDGPPALTTLATITPGGAVISCATDAGPTFTFAACPSDLSSVTRVRWVFPTVLTTTTFPVTTTRPGVVAGFGVDIRVPVSSGTVIPNSATAVSTQTPTPTSSNTVRTTIGSRPVLAIDKAVEPAGTVAPGAVLAYTLVERNTGQDTAYDVVLADDVPALTVYQAGTASAGAEFRVAGAWQGVEPSDPTLVQGLRWSQSTLAIGASTTRSFRVKLAGVVSDATVIPNVASLTGLARVVDPADPTRLISQELPKAEDDARNTVHSGYTVTLTKTLVTTGLHKVGDTLTWKIGVRVAGDSPVAALGVVDVFPSGLGFVSATAGGTFANGRVAWNLGTQQPGYETTLDVVTKVISRPTSGVIGNAVVVGDGRSPSSATAPTGAVKAEAKIAPESGPKLVATKTGPHIINAGKNGRWTITVRNVGKDDARGTVAWDDLPAGFSIVRAKGLDSVTPVRIQKGSVRFDIGVLKAGGVRRLVVTIHVADNHIGGVTYNRARVVARNAKLARGKATVIIKPRVLATRIRPALTG